MPFDNVLLSCQNSIVEKSLTFWYAFIHQDRIAWPRWYLSLGVKVQLEDSNVFSIASCMNDQCIPSFAMVENQGILPENFILFFVYACDVNVISHWYNVAIQQVRQGRQN